MEDQTSVLFMILLFIEKKKPSGWLFLKSMLACLTTLISLNETLFLRETLATGTIAASNGLSALKTF